jgi:hypothetical protein
LNRFLTSFYHIIPHYSPRPTCRRPISLPYLTLRCTTHPHPSAAGHYRPPPPTGRSGPPPLPSPLRVVPHRAGQHPRPMPPRWSLKVVGHRRHSPFSLAQISSPPRSSCDAQSLPLSSCPIMAIGKPPSPRFWSRRLLPGQGEHRLQAPSRSIDLVLTPSSTPHRRGTRHRAPEFTGAPSSLKDHPALCLPPPPH